MKQLFEFLPIARQRPVRILAYAARHRFEGAGKPDRHAMVLDQLEVGGFSYGAASERHHGGPAAGDGPHLPRDSLPLDAPERLFTQCVEDLGDRAPLGGLDVLVDIDEAPPQPFGEESADRRLARSHEAHQVKAGGLLQFNIHRASLW